MGLPGHAAHDPRARSQAPRRLVLATTPLGKARLALQGFSLSASSILPTGSPVRSRRAPAPSPRHQVGRCAPDSATAAPRTSRRHASGSCTCSSCADRGRAARASSPICAEPRLLGLKAQPAVAAAQSSRARISVTVGSRSRSSSPGDCASKRSWRPASPAGDAPCAGDATRRMWSTSASTPSISALARRLVSESMAASRRAVSRPRWPEGGGDDGAAA